MLEAYGGLFAGVCGSWRALSETGVATIPYILTGLAVALGFRGGVFNIGAEGQLYMGALAAVVVGYTGGGWPIWWHLPLALAAGALGGAVWGAIPGVLKARYGAHEVINTIMMNYIAIKLVDYLVKNNIDAKTHYSIAIHKQAGYPWGKGARIVGSASNAEQNAASCVSLPMFPELTADEVDYVIDKVKDWDKQNRRESTKERKAAAMA